MVLHHHEHGAEGEGIEINAHCEQCGKDLDFAAYVIATAVLVGAILVSASLFFISRTIINRLDEVVASNTYNGARLQQQANTQQPAAPAAPGQPQIAANPVDVKLQPNQPYLGRADAKVTIVEYADYQCPFCEKWFISVMPDLKSKYIDTGKVKFIYQDFALLGPDSNAASEAAHCATDQNKFWQYHDYLFTHQGQEGSGWATVVHQKEFAKALGLNTTKFNQCLDSSKYKQEVLDETAAGRTYAVSGTPSFLLMKNGQTTFDIGYIQTKLMTRQDIINLSNGNVFIVGAQPLQAFQQAIDAALK